jgi:hypothetical protein
MVVVREEEGMPDLFLRWLIFLTTTEALSRL